MILRLAEILCLKRQTGSCLASLKVGMTKIGFFVACNVSTSPVLYFVSVNETRHCRDKVCLVSAISGPCID